MILFLYLAVVIIALYYVSKLLAPEMKKTSFDISVSKDVDQGAEKLQILLNEKNKNINLLQKDLKVFQAQTRDFDKIRMLLDEEIRRLREQNRIFRSELGLPALRSKENSTI